jgi:hypothetical protein
MKQKSSSLRPHPCLDERRQGAKNAKNAKKTKLELAAKTQKHREINNYQIVNLLAAIHAPGMSDVTSRKFLWR